MEIKEGTNLTSSENLRTSLSSSVIGELQSNLSNSSSSRVSNTTRSSGKSTPPVSTSLTTEQIQAVSDAATQAVSDADLGDSVDLIALLPKIIEGAQGSLKNLGLSSSETIKVVQVVVFSMTQSLNGRSDNLPSSSADSGSTPLETAISKVAKRPRLDNLMRLDLVHQMLRLHQALWWEQWSGALMMVDLKLLI